MKCKECDCEYDGRLKSCPDCTPAVYPPLEPVDLPMGPIPMEVFVGPKWESWGQTSGGEEIFPGWVLNNRTLYYVGIPSLSPFALGIVRDAFQIKTENRRAVMGDSDFVSTRKLEL